MYRHVFTILWTTALLVLWSSLVAHATTYYVALTGNDSNPGTVGSPFLTIEKGAEVVNPGDTVVVVTGTYARVINTRSGTALARIKFMSQTPWAAKISSTAFIIFENWGNYIDIEGFEIEGGVGCGGQHGVKNYGSFVVIKGNKIHNMRTYDCNTDPDVGGSGITTGTYDNPASNIDVIGNLIYDNGGGTAAVCSTEVGPHGISQVHNGIVANNIVYNNRGRGIHLAHVPHDNLVANNLAFNNGRGGLLLNGQEAPATNNVIVNNILRNNLRYGMEQNGSNGTSNTFINNLTFGNATAGASLSVAVAQGTITADPLMVNWQLNGTGNYHLTSSSPARNAGVTKTEVPCDYDANARPEGAGYDIGPYEYNGTSGGACTGSPVPATPTIHFVNNDPGCGGCSDSNTSAQAEIAATAYRTINQCIANTVGGGECHVLSALPTPIPYNEYIGRTGLAVGSGYTRNLIPNGTAGNPTVIRNVPGHLPVLRPTSQATGGVAIVLLAHETIPAQHIEIIGLGVNGDLCSPSDTNVCNGIFVSAGSHDILIKNNLVRNTQGYGGGAGIKVYANPLVPYNITIDGNTVRNVGFGTLNHGIDVSTYGNIIENNDVSYSSGDNFHGVRGSTPVGSFRDNVIRGNIGHHNAVSRTGASLVPVANMLWGGDDNLIYNNHLHNSAGIALSLQFDSPDNNGIYNNTWCGATAQSLHIANTAAGTLVTNNISHSTLGTVNLGVGTVWTTNVLDVTNPLFVNPCVDVHLQAGSPAATGGTDLSAIFTTDRAGIARTSWGMGAYVGQVVSISPPDRLVFSTPPTSVVQGVNIAPAIVVCAQFNGVTNTNFADPIALMIATDPGGATLTGGTEIVPVNGCATFPTVRINDVGVGYILRAFAIGLTDAMSGAFNVLSAPVAVTPDQWRQYRP